MNINKRWVFIGLFLLALTWIGNIFYYKLHVLKEPIFLKHYYDFSNGLDRISLYYIDNLNNKDSIINIELPELDMGYADFSEGTHNNDNRYYIMKSATISLNRNKEDNKSVLYNDKIITKAIINFSRGKTMTVDLGKIYLGNRSENTIPSLIATYSSSGSDNTSSNSFKADKALKVTGIECSFPELMGDILKIQINDKDVKNVKFPIELKQGEELTIKNSFNLDKRDIRSNYVYNFPIKIITEDASGIKGIGRSYVHYWLQFPQQYHINRLVNGKGGN